MTIEARENPNGMNALQVIEAVKTLAKSQGFYSSLYKSIIEEVVPYEDKFEYFQQRCEEHNFKDVVDLVLYLEG